MRGCLHLLVWVMGAMQSPTQAAPQDDQRDQAEPARPTEALPLPAKPPEPLSVPLTIDVRNDLGRGFRLIEMQILLDGVPIAHRVAEGTAELAKLFPAYLGVIRTGPHAVSAHFTYLGRNRGPFKYLENYRYNVESSYAFVVREEGPSALRVVVAERKGPNIPFERKPVIRFEAEETALQNDVQR